MERYRAIIPDYTSFLAAAERPEPTVFRVRAGLRPEAEVLERLGARGYTLRPVDHMPGFHQVEEGPGPISATLEHWLGWIYVQQASTGVAAPALDPRPADRVLDLCAAPGGKTTHVAELMGDTGCIVASEISEPRIRGLLGNVYRLGHTNVLVVAGDGRAFPEGPSFDRVLVDAPCSGEGTLRRRGGQAPDQSKSFLGYVTRAQRALLEKAVRVTRPGGTILYVTCTFAPEENEAVVSDALARLPVDLEPLDLEIAHEPGVTRFGGVSFDDRLEGAARIYPHHFDSGGLFLARLRRLDAGASGDADGWTPVPRAFPVEPARVGEPRRSSSADRRDAGPGTDAAGPDARIAGALAEVLGEVAERFGVTRDLRRLGWIVRGGRVWLHTLDRWPMEGWTPGEWRAISVGIRAVELDSRGRARPTNDLLRWLGPHVTARTIDLGDSDLRRLVARHAVPSSLEERGPVALRYEGQVVGRGALTVDGLKSEIPRARAKDLERVVDVRESRTAEDAGA